MQNWVLPNSNICERGQLCGSACVFGVCTVCQWPVINISLCLPLMSVAVCVCHVCVGMCVCEAVSIVGTCLVLSVYRTLPSATGMCGVRVWSVCVCVCECGR